MAGSLDFDPIDRAGELWRARWGEASAHESMVAATSIVRVHQIVTAALESAVAPYELTFARYEALVLLAFSRTGVLPMAKIGERLMIHPASATNIIQRLAAQGFVERTRNPDDGRGMLASITDAGREVLEAATLSLREVDFGLDGLNSQQLQQVTQVSRIVRVALGDLPSEHLDK